MTIKPILGVIQNIHDGFGPGIFRFLFKEMDWDLTLVGGIDHAIFKHHVVNLSQGTSCLFSPFWTTHRSSSPLGCNTKKLLKNYEKAGLNGYLCVISKAMDWPLKIQGRLLTETEINRIRILLRDNPSWNRSRLSGELCRLWNWQRPDGQLKDMACRELLRKLESRNLITLPPRQLPGPGRLPTIEPVEVDRGSVSCTFSGIKPVKVVNARSSVEYEKTFNYLVKEYHYLSYSRPVGQNMKYLILGQNERFLGCLLFGSAAWKVTPRDRWIGWTPDIRERNLGLICNNTRFLILPWIKVPHLASHSLGACLRRLPRDWKHRYGTDIALAETFVDTTRYAGTCYKAANWSKVGQTKGRSRQDSKRKIKVPIKDILVYPLRRDFRKTLLAQ